LDSPVYATCKTVVLKLVTALSHTNYCRAETILMIDSMEIFIIKVTHLINTALVGFLPNSGETATVKRLRIPCVSVVLDRR
jgi:hypothetical protein